MLMINRITCFFQILFTNLWLSVSSADFYRRVYQSYSGYGVRYIFTISVISTLIYSISLLNSIVSLKNFFVDNIISKDTETLDYVMQQLPEFHYDGANMFSKSETPLYIHNKSGKVLIIVDTTNKVTHTERSKAPLVLTNSNILISTAERSENAEKPISIPIKYSQVFGETIRDFDAGGLKQYFANTAEYLPMVFIYIVTPLMILKRFIWVLLDKVVTIAIVYLITNLFHYKTSLKTSSRIVLFSAGLPVLLEPVIELFAPGLYLLLTLIQAWTIWLFILSIRGNFRNRRAN